MSGAWIERAEAALGGSAAEDVEVLRGSRPPVLDSEGLRAAVAPFLAALAWGAAIFRELVAESPIDPIALFLRAIALGLTVRTVLAGVRLAGRLRVWRRARDYALAVTDGGLLLRTPAGDRVLPKDGIWSIREKGEWGRRSGARRWSEVFVVLDPTLGATHVTIPPVFERTPGVLAERLMRWRGPLDAPEDWEPPSPNRLPSRVYDESAAGRPPPGTTVILHGRGWLKRGPYATMLLGAVIVDGFLRMGPSAWSQMGLVLPIAVAVSLILAPAVWMVMTRRSIAPRKGVALVLTPAELMLRTASGVLVCTWRGLARLQITVKPSWSILEGYHGARTLLIERKDAPRIRYDEAFLGVPAEVVVGLADGYRRGRAPGQASVDRSAALGEEVAEPAQTDPELVSEDRRE